MLHCDAARTLMSWFLAFKYDSHTLWHVWSFYHAEHIMHFDKGLHGSQRNTM